MKVQRLLLFIAAIFSGLISPANMPSAAAPQANCGKPELRAEGRRSDPGTAEEKEKEARQLSINKWEQLARELHGSQFANWQWAKERKIDCEHYDQPGFNGRVSCVAIGWPCDKP